MCPLCLKVNTSDHSCGIFSHALIREYKDTARGTWWPVVNAATTEYQAF